MSIWKGRPMPLHGAKKESGSRPRRAGPPFPPGTVVLAHEEPRGPDAQGNLRGSGSAFVKMLRLDSELRVTNFEQRAIFVRRACLARREVGKAPDTHESGDPVWEGYRIGADEYRQLDDERVLVLVRRTGRGKASGLEAGQIGSTGAQFFQVCGGKVTRCVAWSDRDRALADLGLEG